jgi:uncharacterized BrkB/YihY/UPF0761 family membrane protein
VQQDHVTKLAAMLALYRVLSVIPILVTLLSVFGLAPGCLTPHTRRDLIESIACRVPGATQFLPLALARFTKHAGPLAVLTVLAAAYFGGRLFKSISYSFGIVFRVPPRSLMPEQFMALKMLLLFIVLIPVLMTVAAVPGFVSNRDVVQELLGNSRLLAGAVTLLSVLTAWLVASALFLAMYLSYRTGTSHSGSFGEAPWLLVRYLRSTIYSSRSTLRTTSTDSIRRPLRRLRCSWWCSSTTLASPFCSVPRSTHSSSMSTSFDEARALCGD